MARNVRLLEQLRLSVSFLYGLLRQTYEEWRNDRAIRLGAGLAYYGVLAIVPLMLLAVVLASLVFSTQEIENYVADAVDSALHADMNEFTTQLTQEAESNSVRGGLGVIGLVSLVIAASFLFLALEDALKVIWHEPVRAGLKHSIQRRALAALVALLAGSLLLVVLIINTVLGIADRIAPDAYLLEVATSAAITGASWALGVTFLAVLIQLLVRDRVSWIALFVGSAITAALLNIGTGLLWTYLQTTGSRGIAGIAGGILLVLVWIYYLAQIFLGGAELIKVLDWRINPPGPAADEGVSRRGGGRAA